MSEDINVTDGTVLEALNNKVDLDGGNYKGSALEDYIHEHCGANQDLSNLTELGQAKLDEKVDKENLIPINAYVIESYESGYDGFVKYSNGLLIQWGLNSSATNNSTVTVTFLEPYKNTNYAPFVTPHGVNNRTTNYASMSRSTGSMTLYVESWAYWLTIGYCEVENG